MSITVQNAVTATPRLPNIHVDVMPDRGLPQTCETGSAGISCIFGPFVLRGIETVRGSGNGDLPGSTTVNLNGDNSLFGSATLSLTPK